MDNSLITRAEDFAKRKHQGHLRKFTKAPYWLHLEEVAETLHQYAAPAEVIAAGWLHDTIEDTDTSYQELVGAFGAVVANIVVEVTDVSRQDSCKTPDGVGNRALRKTIDRQFLAGASWQGQFVKCADMLSNTRDILEHGGGFARTYVPEKKALILVLDKIRNVRYSIWRAAFDQVSHAEQELERRAAAA
ncbi:HD domain-containing protein [Bradyrhizobium elkanii]